MNLGESHRTPVFWEKPRQHPVAFSWYKALQCVLILSKYGLDRLDAVHFFFVLLYDSGKQPGDKYID